MTETYYEKPFKEPKRAKVAKGKGKPKEFVQPVKVVNPVKVTGASRPKGKGRRGRR